MEAMRRAPIGRPRGFDTDEALQRAMVVFWEHGYDGVSLTDLTRAMGITKTSMYAAFGNKEDLFRKALERYAEGPASYGARALHEPTARAVATAYLAGSIHASTQADRPAGCLGVQGFLAAGHLGQSAGNALAAWRDDNRAHLRDRFQRAIDEDDLPAGTDPDTLAHYLMTMANGIAVQAATGATREELQRVADAALHSWPPA
ncbi:TetR/AcrR family transcriptional regulator [Streptomyces sp. 8ZJF_21]|nr:TetR/AcrR family transcriptional regulator [Streptomyces sp. 8ZJF_21]MCD9592610.1 TetR/AcrR family transcriptional regulator [Streptomyces sp. 8ZJF_21]